MSVAREAEARETTETRAQGDCASDAAPGGPIERGTLTPELLEAAEKRHTGNQSYQEKKDPGRP